jgi:hypothetical protein
VLQKKLNECYNQKQFYGYKVSQVTKKMQYITLWFSFFCAISAPAATEFKPAQDYLVVFSSVHLYEKIPSDEKMLDFLLSKEKELPKIEGKVLATLKKSDQIQEFSKKDGKYAEIACQKSPNGAQYGWLLMRDWLCVKVLSSDASNTVTVKVGWLHRSGATSMNPPEGTKLTLYIQHFPPFTKCESGKPPRGVGVDIIEQTCGTTCEIICEKDWKKVLDILSQQTNSGLFFISLIGDRRTDYAAIPVLETSYALFTLEGNPLDDFALKDALKKGRMEAYGPSGTYSYFELFARRLDPSREYTPRYRTTGDIVNALQTGKIDVIYSNSDVMKYYSEQSKLKTQAIRVDQERVPYYIGISKETPEETIAWLKGVIRSNKAEIDKLLTQARLTPLSQ